MAILVENQERIAIITIDRQAQLNALDPESMVELRKAISDFNEDPARWVAILTGAGEKAFCVGADIGKTVAGDASPAQLTFSDDPAARAERYVTALDFGDLKVWKPVIAAINGHAVGGGLEIALWCDIRVASPNATLGLPEVRIGSIPAIGGIRRLMEAVASSDAMYLLLSGRCTTAEEALRIGLVSEVVSKDKLRERAIAIAGEIANCAPLAVRAAKMLSVRGRDTSLEHAIELERMAWSMLKATSDRLEGRQAFLEKRPPHYKGR
jgi:E-phenylitaconyl-CoA hydratase